VYNAGHIKSIWKKRRQVQHSLRSLSDSEFLPGVSRAPRFEYYMRLMSGLERYKD